MWRFHSTLGDTFRKSNFPTHLHLSRFTIFASHRSSLVSILANSLHCWNTRSWVVFLFLNGTKSYFVIMLRGHSKRTSHGKGWTGSMKKVTKSVIGGETIIKKVVSLTRFISAFISPAIQCVLFPYLMGFFLFI